MRLPWVTTNEDTPVVVTLTGDDEDPQTQALTFEVWAGPSHGQVSIAPATGAATYAPEQNYHGQDDFWVVVVDDETAGGPALTSEPIYVKIGVLAVNDPPVAHDEGYFATGGSGQVVVMELDPIFNDEDIDGDDVSIVSATNGTYTLVTVNGDGTVTAELQPDFPFEYTDTFSYTISDGHGGTDSATVSLISGFHPLMAEGPPPALTPALSQRERELRLEALRPIVAEARARWEQAGVGAGVLSTLDAAEFRLADLNGRLLAVAVGNTVLIDRDAAGFGWFVDATPASDGEFQLRGGELVARRGSEAADRMDLLTAVMHEMGHLMGLDHAEDPHDVMFETLGAGVRRNPDEESVAVAISSDQAIARRRARLDELFSDRARLDDVLSLF